MRAIFFLSVMTAFLAGCNSNHGAVDSSDIVGTWTYITDTGRGIGRMTFRADGTYSESFEITTGVGTTASGARGTWTLAGNEITVQYSGYVATGLASGDGASGSSRGSQTYVVRDRVLYAGGAPYVKD